MAKAITFNGKQYLLENLPEEAQVIVNTIEIAEQELINLNKRTVIANLAKENLYQKLAASYTEEWEQAVIEVPVAETEAETKTEKK